MFTRKKIKTPLTLGERLKAARTARRLSLDRVASETKIVKRYLIALEENDYQNLPGNPYIQCFIKAYCQYLGLDETQFIRLYDKERQLFEKLESQPDFKKPIRKISWHYLLVTPKIFRNGLIIFILIICLVYLGRKIQAIVKPPELTVLTPATDLITKNHAIQITGKTELETNLIINGQKVLVQPDGQFLMQLFLQPGVNTIKITAKKRHSAERVEYRRVVVEEW